MKWSELIKIAEAHGYKFVGHGKSMTATATLKPGIQ